MNLIKNKAFKFYTKVLFIVLGILILANPTFAKFNHEKTRTVTEEISVDASSLLSIQHERGLLEVIYYDGEKAKLETNLKVKGDDEEDLETLLSKYEISIETEGSEIIVHSSFNISSWSENNVLFYRWFKMKFDDGTQINSKVRIVESKLKLWIPNIEKLTLKNNHNNIVTSDLPFSLEAKVFSGDIKTGDIDGDLTLNLKYGDAILGDMKDAEIELFTAKMKMNSGGNVSLQSKYSDVKIKNLKELDLNIFEGELEMSNVEGKLDIKGKYADLSFGSIKGGEWDLFECDVVLEEATELEWKDRYGKHKINNIGSLETECFETNFDIKRADKIHSNESRYSEFEIDFLGESFESKAAFEEELDIQEIGDSFSGIDFKCRYGKIKLPVIKSYKLDFKAKYGKVDYDESKLEVIKHIEKNETLTLMTNTKGAGEDSPTIKVRGFEVDLYFED